MQAQKDRFRAQVDELKREIKNLRGRVEQMDGQGPGSVAGTPTIERSEPRMGPIRRETLPRMGPVRRESLAEQQMKIKNVEMSFGI